MITTGKLIGGPAAGMSVGLARPVSVLEYIDRQRPRRGEYRRFAYTQSFIWTGWK